MHSQIEIKRGAISYYRAARNLHRHRGETCCAASAQQEIDRLRAEIDRLRRTEDRPQEEVAS